MDAAGMLLTYEPSCVRERPIIDAKCSSDGEYDAQTVYIIALIV